MTTHDAKVGTLALRFIQCQQAGTSDPAALTDLRALLAENVALKVERDALTAHAERLAEALGALERGIMEDAGGADLLAVHMENDPEHYALIVAARTALSAWADRGKK